MIYQCKNIIFLKKVNALIKFYPHRSGNKLFEKKKRPPETVCIFETTIHRTIIIYILKKKWVKPVVINF